MQHADIDHTGLTGVGGGGGSLTHIDTVTLGSSATSISVSSIPNTYKSLLIHFQLRSDRADNLDGVTLRLGAGTVDSGNNYAYWITERDIGTATNDEQSAAANIWRISRFSISAASATAGRFGHGSITIYNYASAKGASARWDCSTFGSDPRTGMGGGSWGNLSDAIDIVTLFPHSGTNFVTGSEIVVYGYGE